MFLLSRYNIETNHKMNGFISKLTKEQWEREFKGFFNSIKSLCNHIYIGDFNWLKRFSKLKQFKYIQKEIFTKDINFSASAFNTAAEYLELRDQLDRSISDFINEIDEEDLNKDLIYKDSRGKEYTKNLGGLILHMFNHQTHHRGMISIYLEEMGIANDYSNFNSIL